MDDKRIELLRDAPVGKAIVKLALPAIVGLLVNAIYNIVDTMFVSWLGHQATSATQVVFPILLLSAAIGQCFGVGGGSYVSRLLGKNDKKRANQVVSTALVTALGIGIVYVALLLTNLDRILVAFGAMQEFAELARGYGRFIAIGAVFSIMNMTLNNIMRAEGSSKYSMIGMATGAILNIILDPILIFVFDMGIEGAAIATAFSQMVNTAILLSFYLRGKTVLHLGLKHIHPSLSMYTEILKIGSSTSMRQLLTAAAIALMNRGAGQYGGDIAIAAFGLVSKTVVISMYIIFGLANGFQPVAGYAKGSNNYKRLRKATVFTLKSGFAIGVFFAVIFILFSRGIYQIYRPSQEVLDLTVYFSNVYSVCLVMMGISTMIAVFYQAIGKALPAMLLSLSRQGVFLIPSLLILPIFLGLEGIVYSQLVADTLTLILSIILFIPAFRRLSRDSDSLTTTE